MPEDSNKSDKKNAKEQRKPRQRHQHVKAEKKQEKSEEPKSAPKVTVPQKPPVYETPPPEFYQNLKRETDDILKITEEESAKYKKKEIQSNWSKYEVPIETYDEIDEQENLGADYEKLIEAPLSVGGHFQFKHEKSWDLNTGPTVYDKYFEINMEDLNIALCTVPFYERNCIEQSIFNETDILTMNNRSTRFKQKYYDDKSYSTPEIETQDKILNSLREGIKNEATNSNKEIKIISDSDDEITAKCGQETTLSSNINSKLLSNQPVTSPTETVEKTEEMILNVETRSSKIESGVELLNKVDNFVDNNDFNFGNPEKNLQLLAKSETHVRAENIKTVHRESMKNPPEHTSTLKSGPAEAKELLTVQPVEKTLTTSTVDEAPNNPVIESPEDLEKWLDDFLDG